ncbi:MAG: bifunctional DNA primase/polymerase [Methyloceanibacter sp.]
MAEIPSEILAAFELAERHRWAIFPVNGKRPLVKAWPDVATWHRAVLEGWWRQFPKANIGLACGARSGIWVLDVDQGGEETLAALEAQHGKLPPTITVDTGGGGVHYYFAWPQDGIVPNSVRKLGPGLDVRGEGGFVVMPPSLHKSGRHYGFRTTPVPGECFAVTASPWIFGEIAADPKIEKGLEKTVKVQRNLREARDWGRPGNGPADFTGIIEAGQRNDMVYRILCGWRGRGKDEADLRAIAHDVNANQCRPPLSEVELEGIILSASKNADNAISQNEPRATKPRSLASRDGAKPPTRPEPEEEPASKEMTTQELLQEWLLGRAGPDSLRFLWKEQDKLWSDVLQRYVSRGEARELFTPNSLNWLIDNSIDLDTSGKTSLIKAARDEWKAWMPSAWIYAACKFPDQAAQRSRDDVTDAGLSREIHRLLTLPLKIMRPDERQEITTLVDEADRSLQPGWRRVGSNPAFVRGSTPEKPDEPVIALRWDYLTQNGEKWLTERPRKTVIAELSRLGICKSAPIHGGGSFGTIRCYVIAMPWLRSMIEESAAQTTNASG